MDEFNHAQNGRRNLHRRKSVTTSSRCPQVKRHWILFVGAPQLGRVTRRMDPTLGTDWSVDRRTTSMLLGSHFTRNQAVSVGPLTENVGVSRRSHIHNTFPTTTARHSVLQRDHVSTRKCVTRTLHTQVPMFRTGHIINTIECAFYKCYCSNL